MLINHSSTIQDLMLPVISITSSSSSLPNDTSQVQQNSSCTMQALENNHNTYHSINMKDVKVEPSTNLSPSLLTQRKDFSKISPMAKPIDKRREEVNERSILINEKTILPKNRDSRSIQSKQSTSTTTIESILDSDLHAEMPINILSTCHDEQDIVESKSFIHTLDFNKNN